MKISFVWKSLVTGAGAILFIVWLNFGTIDPCELAEIRMRELTFDLWDADPFPDEREAPVKCFKILYLFR